MSMNYTELRETPELFKAIMVILSITTQIAHNAMTTNKEVL